MKIGDIASQETVDYYINVLPPACMEDMCIQLGEPTDHINGRAVYATLKKVKDRWVYAGDCYKGQTEAPLRGV